MTDGLIDQMDQIAEMVSDWAVGTILDVYKVLAPDGRPWNTKAQSMDDRLNEYATLRGNPQAWADYRLSQAQDIAKKLMDSGLPEDEILAVHPYDIATKFAIEYSIEMEDELARRAKHAS